MELITNGLYFVGSHGDLVRENHVVAGEVEVKLASGFLVNEVVKVSVLKTIGHGELGDKVNGRVRLG